MQHTHLNSEAHRLSPPRRVLPPATRPSLSLSLVCISPLPQSRLHISPLQPAGISLDSQQPSISLSTPQPAARSPSHSPHSMQPTAAHASLCSPHCSPVPTLRSPAHVGLQLALAPSPRPQPPASAASASLCRLVRWRSTAVGMAGLLDAALVGACADELKITRADLTRR